MEPYLLIIQSNCIIASPPVTVKQRLSYAVSALICFVAVNNSGNVFRYFAFFFCFLFKGFLKGQCSLDIMLLLSYWWDWENLKGLKQLRLISFQRTFESEVGLWISQTNFHGEVFVFFMLYFQNFWSNLLDRMLRMHTCLSLPSK